MGGNKTGKINKTEKHKKQEKEDSKHKESEENYLEQLKYLQADFENYKKRISSLFRLADGLYTAYSVFGF